MEMMDKKGRENIEMMEKMEREGEER